MEFFGSEGLEDSKVKFARAFKAAREKVETPRGKVEEAAEAAEPNHKVWPPLDANPDVLRQHIFDQLRMDTASSVSFHDKPSAMEDKLCSYDEVFSRESKSKLYGNAFRKEWTGFFRLKPDFEKLRLPLANIDPLSRFGFARTQTMYSAAFNDLSACTGNVFELLVGHHCKNNKSVVCQNKECAQAGTIKWNGGGSTSWQDFFCIACGAYYEMKSKTSSGSKRALWSHETSGGSYSRFVQQKKQGKKHFMVILNREPTSANESTNLHSVYCSRIKFGVPSFSEKTIAQFNTGRKMGLKTQVFFEEPVPWFSLPVPAEFPVDGEWFKWEILEELFGEKVKKIQRFARKILRIRRSQQTVDASKEIEALLGLLALNENKAAEDTKHPVPFDVEAPECPHFQRNMCTRGEACVYRHAGRLPVEADKECRFFHEHRCTDGAECQYRHGGRAPRDSDRPECRFFQRYGNCRDGASCRHKHGGRGPRDEDIIPECKSFRDYGQCRYGASCRYKHGGRAPTNSDSRRPPRA
jgi:hypothetical protein